MPAYIFGWFIKNTSETIWAVHPRPKGQVLQSLVFATSSPLPSKLFKNICTRNRIHSTASRTNVCMTKRVPRYHQFIYFKIHLGLRVSYLHIWEQPCVHMFARSLCFVTGLYGLVWIPSTFHQAVPVNP